MCYLCTNFACYYYFIPVPTQFQARDNEVLRQQEERRKANNATETETRMRGTTVSAKITYCNS